jgi:cellulose synthase/poly-beta-1,6-N-acetylglucosamine synthase-like glycosyltransferase
VLIGIFLIGLGLNALFTVQVFVAILSFVYFIDVVFNFFLILKSLHSPPEISPAKAEILALKDSDLPIYTILCPLYKEAHVIPQFVEAISALDWPKDKLEVMLLLEEDDTGSIAAVKKMSLPAYVKVVVVPHSFPKTKPKACNYGLSHATGEYLVIYDAEDIPDPLQLKKAYLAFQSAPNDVLCLQAKLNYFNPNQNLLTRFFTAEYSLWFDVTLTGLQSLQTTIPLGGTSNHFRTKDLLTLQGWDPFNVTEDADLGMRLFKAGYKTAIIDSTTLEEANSKVKNWIRQRSRWIKGYMQTYLVHNREIIKDIKNQKIHNVFFHLTIGGKIAFILINVIVSL